MMLNLLLTIEQVFDVFVREGNGEERNIKVYLLMNNTSKRYQGIVFAFML